MEEYMPSEVARLVLGYLKEMGCTQTWKLFLSESPNLQEYGQLLRQGKEYPTTIAGRSLHTILQEHYTLTSNDRAIIQNVSMTRPSISPAVPITETSFRTPEQASISSINKQSVSQRIRTRSAVAFNRNCETVNRLGNPIAASSACNSSLYACLSPVRNTAIHSAANSAISSNTSLPESEVRTTGLYQTAVRNHSSDSVSDNITTVADVIDHNRLCRTFNRKELCFNRNNSHHSKYPDFLVSPKSPGSVPSNKCNCRRNNCSSQSESNAFRIQNEKEKQANFHPQQLRVSSVIPDNSELPCETTADSSLRLDTIGSHIQACILSDKPYQINSSHCSCEVYCHSENSNACQSTSTVENAVPADPRSAPPPCTRAVNIPAENSVTLTNTCKYFRSVSVQTSKSPVKSKAQNICLNSHKCSLSVGSGAQNINQGVLFSTKDPDVECILPQESNSSCPTTTTQTVEKSVNVTITTSTKSGSTCSSISHEETNQSVVHLVSESAAINSISPPASPPQTTMTLIPASIHNSNSSVFQESNSNVLSSVYLNNSQAPATIMQASNALENSSLQKVTSQFYNQNPSSTALMVYSTNTNVFTSEVSSLPTASSTTNNCYSSCTDVNATCIYKNALMSTGSFSPVPVCNNQPPPYCRAPGTNSPRIILSHERSLLPSLTTPVKDIFTYEEFRSPRRKNLIPRRRLLSPLTKHNNPDAEIPGPSVIHSEDSADHWAIVEEIINFPPLIEKIVENINKVKSTELSQKNNEELMEVEPSSPVRPSNSPVFQDIHVPDTVIKDILIRTETDPVFEEYIHHLCEKHESSRDGLEMSPAHDTNLFSPVQHHTPRILHEELDENSSQHHVESLSMVNQPKNSEPNLSSPVIENSLIETVAEKTPVEGVVALNTSTNTNLQYTIQVPHDVNDNADIFHKDGLVVSVEKKSTTDQRLRDHSPNQERQCSPLCGTSENTNIRTEMSSPSSPSKHPESNVPPNINEESSIVSSHENGKSSKNQDENQEKSVSSPKQLLNLEPKLHLEKSALVENNSLGCNETHMVEVMITNQSTHQETIDKNLISVNEQVSNIMNGSLEGETNLPCSVIDEISEPNSVDKIGGTEKQFSCVEADTENSQELLRDECDKIACESADGLAGDKAQKTTGNEKYLFHEQQQFQPISEESGSPTVIFVPTNSSDLQSMPANSSAFLIVHSSENVKSNFNDGDNSETPVHQITEPANGIVSENHINLENDVETLMKNSGASSASCNALAMVNNPPEQEYWTPVVPNGCGTFEFAYEGAVSNMNSSNVKSNVLVTATPMKISSGSDFHFVTLSPGQLFGISSVVNLQPDQNYTRMPEILPKLPGTSNKGIGDNFAAKTKRGRPRKDPTIKKRKPAICFPESKSKTAASKNQKQVIMEKANASDILQSIESSKGSAKSPKTHFALRMKGTHHSPQLKSLISSARQLAGHGGLLGRTHVRALDFGPEAGKKDQQITASENSICNNLINNKLLNNGIDFNSSFLTNISNINTCIKDTNNATLESFSQLHMPNTTVTFVLSQNENVITLHAAEKEQSPIKEMVDNTNCSNYSTNKNLSASLNINEKDNEIEKDISITLDKNASEGKTCSLKKTSVKRQNSKKGKSNTNQNLVPSNENCFSSSNEISKQVWVPTRVASAASGQKSSSKNSFKLENKKRHSLSTNSNSTKEKKSSVSRRHNKPKSIKNSSSTSKLKVKSQAKNTTKKDNTSDNIVKFPDEQISSFLDVEKNVAALHGNSEQVWEPVKEVSVKLSQKTQVMHSTEKNTSRCDKDAKKGKSSNIAQCKEKASGLKRITPITLTKKVCKTDTCVMGKEFSPQKISKCFHYDGETTNLSELSEAVYFISNKFDETDNGVSRGAFDSKLDDDDAEVAQTLVTLSTTVPSSILPDKSAQRHSQEQVPLYSEVACEVIVSPTVSPEVKSRSQHSRKAGRKRKVLDIEEEVKKKARTELRKMNVDEFLSKVKY